MTWAHHKPHGTPWAELPEERRRVVVEVLRYKAEDELCKHYRDASPSKWDLDRHGDFIAAAMALEPKP